MLLLPGANLLSVAYPGPEPRSRPPLPDVVAPSPLGDVGVPSLMPVPAALADAVEVALGIVSVGVAPAVMASSLLCSIAILSCSCSILVESLAL